VGAEDGPAPPAAFREPLSVPVRLSTLDSYRLWSKTWESDPSAIVALETRWLSPWLAGLEGKVFLDLSCGVGRWLIRAQAQGATVFGTDLCTEMLAEAKKKSSLSARLALADTRRLPFRDACADVALCALSLGHITPLESAITELARVVRRGGDLIVTDFHPGALRRGWKRTFRSNGELYEVETYSYTIDDLLECGRRQGLILQELLEVCFDEPEHEIFRVAGKPDLFERVRDIPAVLLARWKRP
jgi:Methylase involved in ubiquinone/menaquinone biosynthesis